LFSTEKVPEPLPEGFVREEHVEDLLYLKNRILQKWEYLKNSVLNRDCIVEYSYI
jgi:hypothetical protein